MGFTTTLMCQSKPKEIVFNGIVSTEGVKIKEAGGGVIGEVAV